MLIRNGWYVAAWASELELGRCLARTILNVPVVLYRGNGGGAFALEDRCCHRGLPLSMGRVDGDLLRCGYHGLEFNGAGRCVRIPGQEDVPSVMKVRSFPVAEKNTLLWIWCGEAAKADSADIPDFPWYDDPNWPFIPHAQRLECAFNLVVDNLLDMSHLAYVHEKTIGGRPDSHALADLEVEKTPRGVRFTRWMEGTTPPPSYVAANIGFAEGDPIDRWQEFEFVAPASVLQFTGSLPAAAEARRTGQREGGWAIRIMHNMTPETENSCHYFWGASHGFSVHDSNVTKWLYEQVRDTFLEDEAVLQAQQARLKELRGKLIPTKHDAAVIAAELVLLQLSKAEQPRRAV